MALEIIKELSKLNDLITNKKDFVFMVSANWCPPCRKFTPIVEEVSNEEEFKNIVFIKVNVDELPEVNNIVGVGSLPTILMWRQGKELYREIGMMSKDKLINSIKSTFI